MSARIARGSSAKSAAKAPSRGATGGGGRRRAPPPPPPGLFDSLPVNAAVLRRMGWMFLLVLLAGIAVAVAASAQLPQFLGAKLGEQVGAAGFAVKRVEIKGLNRMERLPVYAVALDQNSMAMPLVDLAGTRERLLRFGWVREARVSRRWPDTLVVDVVEREPAAVWQRAGRLSLIDRDGVELEQVKLEALPDLPLVIGPSANRHAGALDRLLAAAPEVRPMLAGATWVGDRRWDLRFESGEVLALPEGQERAIKALVHFARMDKATQLLGRGMVRFDMRIPGRMVVRVSNEPGGSVPVAIPQDPDAPDPATTI